MAPLVQNTICFFSQSVSAVIAKCCIHFWEILLQMFGKIYKYFVQPMARIRWFDVLTKLSVEIHTCFRDSHPTFNPLRPNNFCMDQWAWSVLIQGTCLAPSHYLKQWNVVNCYLKDELQWRSNGNTIFSFNALRPSDAIWQHRSGSTLAQVMACCLTAPSPYLNQCRLIISKV